MVRIGASRSRALLLTFLLVSLLFAAVPSGAGLHGGAEIPRPRMGAQFTYGTHGDQTLNLSLDRVDHRLLGHHEERTVVVGTTTDTEGQVWYEQEVFDAETGLYAGQGYVFEHERPALPPLAWYVDSDYVFLAGPTVHTWLPESVLWGRSVWVDASWDIPVRNEHCSEAEAGAEVATDWTDQGEVLAIHALVWRTCVHEGDLYGVTWDLEWGSDRTPLADTRVMIVTDPSGVVSEREVPATLEPGDGWELPFSGRSHVPFWAERDQTLDYSPHSGMLPTDPEPHAIFEVNEAAQMAYDLDDEVARVFRSSTTEPTLFQAQMSSRFGLEGGSVRWTIGFTDPSGANLWVRLSGIKVPGQPLLVQEASAGEYPFDIPQPDEPDAALAHPGGIARLVDGVAESRGARVADYNWHRWYDPSFHARLHHSGGTEVDDREEWVASGLADGIVTGHGITHSGYAPDLPSV